MGKSDKKTDLSKMYSLMLDDEQIKYLSYLKFLARARAILGLPRCGIDRNKSAESMVIRFLRKEMGVSAYGDLVAELGTRICRDSKNYAVRNAKLALPEYKRVQYDAIKNVITLEQGTTINLNTGVVQSGTERYMKCAMLDKFQCETLKAIRIERLVRDEQMLRNKRKKPSKAKKAVAEVIDAKILMGDVIADTMTKSH